MQLVGRGADVERVEALLARGRPVVVQGVAGVGKSALASAIGAQHAAAWLDLVGVVDPDEVARRGARMRGGLLVVDGADLLLADGWRALERVLARWAGPALITVRRADAGPDRSHRLDPLADADGVKVLRGGIGDHARAATLPEAPLRALSAAVGGLPGRLVLTAPLLRLEPPEVLLARLEDLDATVRPPAPPLTAEAEAVWVAAAVVDGPVDADTLGALCGRPVEAEVLALLDAGRLVAEPVPDASVRVVPDPTRPAPHISPLARVAALDRLAAARLPRWETDAVALDGPASVAAFARLTAATPALEALARAPDPDTALRAALALAALECRAGPVQRTLDRDSALTGGGGSPALRAAWAAAVGRAAERLGRFRWGLERLAQDPAPDGSPQAADHASVTALLLDNLGERAQAIALHDRAEALAGDGPLRDRLAFRAAVGAFRAGDLEGARAALARTGNPPADTLVHLQCRNFAGIVRRELGEPSDVLLAACVPADAEWRDTGHLEQGPLALVLRGVLLADLERWDAASEALGQAADALDQLGRPAEAAVQRCQRASLALHRGAAPAALDALGSYAAAFAPAVRSELTGWRAVLRAVQGAAAEAADDGAAALAGLDQARRGARGVELAACVLAALRGAGAPPSATERLEALVGPRLPPGLRAALDGLRPRGSARWEHHLIRDLLVPPRRCRVAADGAGFVLPDGTRVDLSRRRALQRVLAALATANGPLDLPALVEAGWPGEALVPRSGRRRLEVALSTLRALGLRPWLHTRHGADGAAWQLDAVVAESVG
ncbi:MAG: hypothetical protein ACI8PZ_000064 [Myxococcota bacterium]